MWVCYGPLFLMWIIKSEGNPLKTSSIIDGNKKGISLPLLSPDV